jgi:hypothetical protein
MKLSVACLAASVLLAAAPSMAQVVASPDPDPLPPPLHAPNGRWAAKGWADRIVLSPAADAARGAAVAWRTDARQTAAEAQIAEEIDGPLLGFAARTVAGTTAPIENENGRALYHQARFDGLKPDTRYVYRVRAADGWSEWLPFRTAKAEFAPFRFIYLGDTQNDILEVASRVIRSAFKEAGPAALVVHAGDLVAQREVKVHDDEWGEWTEAGGRVYAMTPQLPASGNHEYVDHILPNGEESRLLGPHWPLQFAPPDNGAEGAEATSYYVDYQGVRFIVLDGTAAIDLGAGESQTRWLDKVLAESPARWNVALFHQPIYTCASARGHRGAEGRLEADFRRPQHRSGAAGTRSLLRPRLQPRRGRGVGRRQRGEPSAGTGLCRLGHRLQDVRTERPGGHAAGARGREHRTVSADRRRGGSSVVPRLHGDGRAV